MITESVILAAVKLLQIAKDMIAVKQKPETLSELLKTLSDTGVDLNRTDIAYSSKSFEIVITHKDNSNYIQAQNDHLNVLKSLVTQEFSRLVVQHKNLIKIMQYTVADFAEDELVPSTEIGQEWLARFEEEAKDIESDFRQRLWGKILAGEIRNPGHIQLRTLRFLKDVSQSEAERISHLFSFFIFDTQTKINFSFYNSKFFYNKAGITPNCIRELIELGLITSVATESPSSFQSTGGGGFLYNKKLIYWEGVLCDRKFTCPPETLILTRLGREIFTVVNPTPSNECCILVNEAVKVDHPTKALYIADISMTEGNQFTVISGSEMNLDEFCQSNLHSLTNS
jgi:hypothetical protein